MKKPEKHQVHLFYGRSLSWLEVRERERTSEFLGQLSQVSYWKTQQVSPHHFLEREPHTHIWGTEKGKFYYEPLFLCRPEKNMAHHWTHSGQVA